MMTHQWRVRKFLPDRFGQACRIIKVGKRNSALVEFEDGTRFVTIRYFVRRTTRRVK
jgi:hypothetical protein